MKIYENDDCDEVIINEFRMAGSITDAKCKKCNNNLIHSEEYDTFFCPKCNEWGEAKCNDPNCEFCQKRPDKPLGTK